MHIYFSGIGAGTGPLALIAKQAGYEVSGSDKQNSDYVEYLKKHGISNIHIGQTTESINAVNESSPIDWLVYSSAVVKEKPNHPEILFAKENDIKLSKRDELINRILSESGQKMLAIAGTHGKTTTTAMAVCLFKQLEIPVSFSVGAKLSFGDMAEFDSEAEYFIYEADEYDRNFLNFSPYMSVFPGIDYDHPDIYPTREEYYEAFQQFIEQSENSVIWDKDAEKLGISNNNSVEIIKFASDYPDIKLAGLVNRENAHEIVIVLQKLGLCDYEKGIEVMNRFPGVSRRFERIIDNVYTDYAHTPEKIRGAIQMAREAAGDNVIVIYEGLHNTRQNFIREELIYLFDGVKKLYVVPSYLAREDESLEMLTPEKLCEITQKPADREPAKLDNKLKKIISQHVNDKDLVLCLTAGGGGSLDEWLREEFKS
jgi:UDP-N-acetylmuramate--alanine ligase